MVNLKILLLLCQIKFSMKNFIFVLLNVLATSLSAQNYNLELKSSVKYPGQVLANVWTYHANGREYALVGAARGMSIVDITDPSKPKEIKQLLDGIENNWREIKTYKNFAYITTEGGGGLAIADLSNLPDTTIPFHKYTGDKEIAGKLGRIHALHVDTTKGFVYCYGMSGVANGGAIFLDLNQDPYNPTYAGEYNINYIHDGYADNDTLYGGHIYGGYFSVIDCTDKKNPKVLQTTLTPTKFTHNTWLDNSKKHCFTTDENSGSFLGAYDISDLGNIKLVDKIQPTPGSGSIVHNTYVRGEFAITSWYKDGFTITDISRPENLIQVARYDLFPQGTGNGFEGTWGVAPYLPSGTIVCSNINEYIAGQNNGVMYVMAPTYIRAAFLEGKVTLKGSTLPINDVTVSITGGDPLSAATTDIAGEYKTGQYKAGQFDVVFTKLGYGTKTVKATLINGEVTFVNVEMESLGSLVVNTLTSTNNTAVAKGIVRLKNASGEYLVTTDVNGNFVINAFESGVYEVIAGAWGYGYYYDAAVQVNAGTVLNLKLDVKYKDDFVLEYNWIQSGAAPRGKWVRAVPVGTVYQNNAVNPAADVDGDVGNMCYVTGNAGGNPQDDDIDDGETVITSPVMDLSAYKAPIIKYRTWFFAGGPFTNPPDTMTISVTNGVQTVVLEKIIASESKWKALSSFNIKGLLPLTNNMKLIVSAADYNPGNWVEGGFDAFEVTDGTVGNFDLTELLFAVSPNPTTSLFNVKYNVPALEAAEITVASLDGKIIKRMILGANSGELSFGEDLPNGSFIISLMQQQQIIKSVMVIKH